MTRTFSPTEASLFLTISDEERTLEEMFEQQNCAAIAARLNSGERYVVVRLEISLTWAGFEGRRALGAIALPPLPDDKSSLVHSLTVDTLFLPAHAALQRAVADAGWEAEFQAVDPDDVGDVNVVWS